MSPSQIWLLGQDAATVSMAERFLEEGIQLFQSGFHHSIPELPILSMQKERYQQPDIIVLPPCTLKEGTKCGGIALDQAFFHRHQQAQFVSFASSRQLDKMQQLENISLFLYRNEEPFRSVFNSAMAEGILYLLLEEESLILKQRHIAILGRGSLSILLYRLLTRLSTSVTRFERKQKGNENEGWSEMEEFQQSIQRFDSVIVLDPDWVWEEEMLKKLHYQSTIIQFETSCLPTNQLILQLGIRLITLPSLPGVFAPRSCGKAAAETILRCDRNILPKEEQ